MWNLILPHESWFQIFDHKHCSEILKQKYIFRSQWYSYLPGLKCYIHAALHTSTTENCHNYYNRNIPSQKEWNPFLESILILKECLIRPGSNNCGIKRYFVWPLQSFLLKDSLHWLHQELTSVFWHQLLDCFEDWKWKYEVEHFTIFTKLVKIVIKNVGKMQWALLAWYTQSLRLR